MLDHIFFPGRFEPLPKQLVSFPIDYGGVHPFEYYQRRQHKEKRKKRLLQGNDIHERKTVKDISLDRFENESDIWSVMGDKEYYRSQDHLFQSMRIKFDISLLEKRLNESSDQVFLSNLILLKQEVLPAVAHIWGSLLRVVPVRRGGIASLRTSGENKYCPSEITSMLPDGADFLAYATVDKRCTANTLASAVVCERDQYDRPITGTIDFCLKNMKQIGGMEGLEKKTNISSLYESIPVANINVSTTEENRTYTDHINFTSPSSFWYRNGKNTDAINNIISIAVHEFGHVLGMSSASLSYFRNPITGEPLTPRPFSLSHVQCVDGRKGQYLGLPSLEVMRPVKDGSTVIHFEVVSPTVRQVAQNQFDCPTLSGARLENQPTSPMDCFGSHWDERYFFTETMSAIHSSTVSALSPLTLALLEDSGWYRANYRSPYVAVSTFGLGAGCDFIRKPCLNKDRTLPSHAKGFFCNTPLFNVGKNKIDITKSPQTCNPTHTHKANCDWETKDYASYTTPKHFQYVSDSDWGPIHFERADFCPIAHLAEVSCVENKRKGRHPLEIFGPNSMCYDTDSEYSLCLQTKCNSKLRKIQVRVGITDITCDYDGQKHSLPSSTPTTFTCPRLAVICPTLICPSNCAGRGVCGFPGRRLSKNMTDSIGCACFDINDKSEGCYESLPPFYKQSKRKERNDGAILVDLCYLVLILSLTTFLFSYTMYKKEKRMLTKDSNEKGKFQKNEHKLSESAK